MSLFSGHGKTWLKAPLHSGVLSSPSQTEHPRPAERFTHADKAAPEAGIWMLSEERDKPGPREETE